MDDRILIAGIGNIFLGDDAFGVEVVRELLKRPPVPGVRVVDFGIRSLGLAYALLDPWEVVVLVDAVPRGEVPGTLYTIEPDMSSIRGAELSVAIDAHSMDPVRVLQLAASMGEISSRVYLIGCEPADCGGDEGRMALSAEVAAAVPEAVRMVEKLLCRLVENTSSAITENQVHEVR